jgi:hypothetical protein
MIIMNNRLFKIVLIVVFSILWSCGDDDAEIVVTPPREHLVQFAFEEKNIEQFLTEYCPVITYNTAGDVTNIEVKKRQFSTDESFASFYHDLNVIENNGIRKGIPEETNEGKIPTTYPVLFKKNFQHQGIKYSYWYLMVKPGAVTKIPYGYTQSTSARPTEHDGVLLDYKGYTLKEGLYDSTTKYALNETAFETTNYPVELRLTGVIRGFSRILPKFGSSATTTINNDGSVVHQGYGSGIMIFPSGMGYYNNSSTNIPAYSPLLFTFNLYDVKRYDLDQDGIMSYREDLNKDGYFYANFSSNLNVDNDGDGIFDALTMNDDTDGDGTTNALDYDDDGDGVITFLEVKDKTTGLPFLDKEHHKLTDGTIQYICNNGNIPAYLNKDKKRKNPNVECE